jgi:GTPase SAR1 family protein
MTFGQGLGIKFEAVYGQTKAVFAKKGIGGAWGAREGCSWVVRDVTGQAAHLGVPVGAVLSKVNGAPLEHYTPQDFRAFFDTLQRPVALTFGDVLLGDCGITWAAVDSRKVIRVEKDAATLGVQVGDTLTKVGSKPWASDQSTDNLLLQKRPCTLHFAKTNLLTLRVFDFAGQREYYLTHHLFLTQKTLYVIAFDIRKFRPQHFQSMIMFFVAKLQSRVPAAPVVLVGTHADEVSEDMAKQRCTQVLDALRAKQQRERRRLNAQILKLEHELGLMSGNDAVLTERRKGVLQRVQQLRLLLGRLVQLPVKVHAVSSARSMKNIPELQDAIVASALDQQLFPTLGRDIPRLYEQIRILVREWRAQMPYCELNLLVEKVEHALLLRAKDVGGGSAEQAAGGQGTRERVLAALGFLHDLGEVAHFREGRDLSGMVFLSLQWLVDVTKMVIRHDHSDALLYEDDMRGLMSPKVFEATKQAFVRRGKLELVLLRWLWRDLKLDESAFATLVCMLQQFGLAMATTAQSETGAASTGGTGREDSTSLEKPEVFLLVPAFFQDYLPARSWRVQCPESQLQVARWFDFADTCPSGVVQRLQVLLYLEWPVGKHVLAKEGMVLAVGGCRVLVQLISMVDGTSEHEGLQVKARGEKGSDGLGSREQWDTVDRVVLRIQQLLVQWPGIVVSQFVQWEDGHGLTSEWQAVELQRLRRAGHSSVSCNMDDDTDDVGGKLDDTAEPKAEVSLRMLLGPVREITPANGQVVVDGIKGRDADAMAQQVKELQQHVFEQAQTLKALQQLRSKEVEEQKAEHKEEEEDADQAEAALVPYSSGSYEEEGYSVYRHLTEQMRRYRIRWVMLSYAWVTQVLVLRLYKELVRRNIPVWMDIMGGMKANVNDSMSEAVEGAAVVVPVLCEAYEKSHDCNKEINYVDAQRKPIVPVMASQSGILPSGAVGVITAGLLWTALTPDMSDEDFGAAVNCLERTLRAKGVRELPKDFNRMSSGLLGEGEEQELRCQRDEAQDEAPQQPLQPPQPHQPQQEEPEGASEENQSVEQWLVKLRIKSADATKYAAALDELGVDVVEHLYALESADLEEVGMKKIHRKLVLRKINSGGTVSLTVSLGSPRKDSSALVQMESASGGHTRVPRAAPRAAPRLNPKLFMSHAWAADALGRSNHDRVARINNGLKSKGTDTWFDTQGDMKDNTLLAMTAGIDECDLVVVFVTRIYIDKCKKKGNDNCKLEFEYSYNRKSVERLLVVVMEPDCASPASWDGPVGATLGTQLYISCVGDDDGDFERAVQEIDEKARQKFAELGPSGAAQQ